MSPQEFCDDLFRQAERERHAGAADACYDHHSFGGRTAPPPRRLTLNVEHSSLSLDVQQVPRGTGSGFVWDKKGHVVTNYHVIQGADVARVTGRDLMVDLAPRALTTVVLRRT